MKIRIKIQGILIFLAAAATIAMSNLLFPHWKKEPADELLDALGIALVLFGFLFRISARGYKEQMSNNGWALVKDGPYALVRNPMYFGTLMIGTGVILVLFELWTLLLFGLIFLLIYAPQIKKEEAVLLKRFGEEYKDYCKKTPKYFPKPRHLFYLNSYLSLKLRWFRKEWVSFLAAVVLIIAIETWEDATAFGYEEFSKELLEFCLIIASFAAVIMFFRKKKA